MLINDSIYGEFEIKDQVIIDIINTKIFQRLKKISQDGAPHFIQPVRNVTRFEHSIGVWYLSNKYGMSMEEQIASLIHDISHTAFSHVIDFVVKNEKHEFADSKLDQMIYDSEIPMILEKYGYDIKKVLDKSNFKILDNSLPDISVDRWDYFMRDGFAIGFLPLSIINSFLSGINKKNDTFYFKDVRLASTFAIMFLNFSRLIWLDPTSHGSFFLLAEAIKIVLEDKHISEDDFFTDDEVLYQKLENSNNAKVKELLERLKPGREFVYSDKDSAEFFGPNKPRFVDPLIEVDDKLVRVSELVPSLKHYFEEFSARYKNIGVTQI